MIYSLKEILSDLNQCYEDSKKEILTSKKGIELINGRSTVWT